ncbi:uncharacterized protein N7511_011178 [Penicillium nucicola]|uniref:uncharacterized protein n=1 Tax=Penicillium nucicola TaxID=1850975 RepID=UPI002545B84C|nr:uncharacterized protein N7511_011178 [Penicillium nucicola]KAJ5742777.1 hypothetical protein N7511_011178 [Penicillium nucicola]
MAYQLYQRKQRTSSSSAPSTPLLALRQPTNPPIRPPPVHPPQSAVANASGPKRSKEETFDPYPLDIDGKATPHSHITVEKVNTAHIPSLARITGLLLPIRYPNSFYTATITDPVIASLSRVAIYHDHPVAEVPGVGAAGTDKVIGGIRCRLERVHQLENSAQDPEIQGHGDTNLYIQTLHLLSPYRGHGVAASLLNTILFASPPDSKTKENYRVSELVKHYNIRAVTAHVHEANEDAMNWYLARGFKVDGHVDDYYRRLKPSGAKIVRLDLQWDEVTMKEASPESSDSQKGPCDNLEDEDWEKVEAEDGDEGDHGIQLLSESRFIEKPETPSRKRKAE